MARAPSIFYDIVDVNPDTTRLTGNEKILIKYHSDAKATMNPFVYDGASIYLDTLRIINGNQTAYGSEIPFSHTFRNVSSNEFIFSCEDSNNMTGTAKVTADMIDYVKPTCYILNTTIDGDGNLYLQCQGNSFNESFGIVPNVVVARCRYAALEGSMSYSTWQKMNVTRLSSNGYIADISFEGLQYDKNYIFEVAVQDELNTITTTKVISSKPIFHWGKDDFTFEVPVSMPRLSIGGASIEHGIWTPELDYYAVTSYETCEGWYNKVGNTVSIGFNIKATCDSGYDAEQIIISGLPFDPKYRSAGGGLCSGAYVAGNYTFQCFVAETNGTITTRVQSCNNTANTNLSTSASGCNYRNGGGEVTLSGTITFLTYE